MIRNSRIILALVFSFLLAFSSISITTAESFIKTNGTYSATVKDIYNDGKTLYVIFSFSNSSTSESNSFGYKFTIKAYQKGIECDTKYSANKDTSKEIKNGATIDVTKGFTLINTTDIVEVSIDEWLSWSSKPVTVYYDPTSKQWGSKDEISVTPTPMVSITSTPTTNPNAWICPSCQKEVTTKFCPDCGTNMPTPKPTPIPTPSATPVPMDTNAPVQNVVNITYTLKTSQYAREGQYTGELVDGFPHGFGLFVTHNSVGVEWFYKGEWEYGLPNGEGAEYWENGQVEKGVFVQGLFAYGDTVAMGVKGKWFNEFDANGNQKYAIYNGDKLYADGYANRNLKIIKSSQYYDNQGNPTSNPQKIDVGLIVYP